MKMKNWQYFFAAAALTTVTAAGCSGGQKETAADAAKDSEAVTTAEQTTGAKTEVPETTAEAAEADEENYDTGDASKDNARNQDGIGENELLVVSFGTSYNDSRRLTIGAIEDAVEKAFPDFAVRRGFTSQIIIDHVKSRDNVAIDNVGEALDRAEKNGVRNLVIQPTHLMNGLEYTDLVNEAAEYSDAFDKVAIGKPLLTTEDDFRAVMKLSQRQLHSMMTVRQPSVLWDTAQRQSPTRYMQKCRICLQRQVIRITMWVPLKQRQAWMMSWQRWRKEATRRWFWSR